MAYHRGGHAGAVAVSYSTNSMPTPLSPSRRYSSGNTGTASSGVGTSTSSKLSSYRSSGSSSFDRPNSYYSSGSSSTSGYSSSHRSSYSSDYRRYCSPVRSLSVSSSSYSDTGTYSAGASGSAGSLGISVNNTTSNRYSTSSLSSRDRSESRDTYSSSVASAAISNADFIAKYSAAHYVPNISGSNERQAAAAAATTSSSSSVINGYGNSTINKTSNNLTSSSSSIFGGNSSNAKISSLTATSKELSPAITQGRPPRAARRSPINTVINNHVLQPDITASEVNSDNHHRLHLHLQQQHDNNEERNNEVKIDEDNSAANDNINNNDNKHFIHLNDSNYYSNDPAAEDLTINAINDRVNDHRKITTNFKYPNTKILYTDKNSTIKCNDRSEINLTQQRITNKLKNDNTLDILSSSTNNSTNVTEISAASTGAGAGAAGGVISVINSAENCCSDLLTCTTNKKSDLFSALTNKKILLTNNNNNNDNNNDNDNFVTDAEEDKREVAVLTKEIIDGDRNNFLSTLKFFNEDKTTTTTITTNNLFDKNQASADITSASSFHSSTSSSSSSSSDVDNLVDINSGGEITNDYLIVRKNGVSKPNDNHQAGDNTNNTPSTSRRGDSYSPNGSNSSNTASSSSSNGVANTSQTSATAHQNIYRAGGINEQIEGSPTIRAPRNRLQTPRDERCGLNGLRNIGNTCFMNSVIQCLSNTKPLLEYLVNEQYLADINTTTSGMKGALIKAFSQVIQELWEVGGDHVVNTASLKSQIQRFAPRFMGYSQQDAQEFLRYLLEGLHEDVNRVTVRPQPIHTDIPEHYTDSQKAAESWKRYLRNEDSTIVDVFVGQLRSSLHCTSCGHVSVTLDPFWDLSLPIPTRSGTVKLNQCLEHFTKEEVLDGDEKPTCSKCQTRRKCTKSFSIQKFPKILVIHLKRFSPMERFRGKLNTLVDFPLTGLDLGAFSAPRVAGCTYNLYGVANHSGTTYSGHYTAYCKHPYSGEWHEYNDSRVSSIASRSVVSSEGYVLFYEQQPHSSNL